MDDLEDIRRRSGSARGEVHLHLESTNGSLLPLWDKQPRQTVPLDRLEDLGQGNDQFHAGRVQMSLPLLGK